METGQERQHEEGEKEDECNLTHKQQGQSNLLCCPVKNGYGSDYYFLGPFHWGGQKTLDIPAVGAGGLIF